jgi:phosphatidylglycerophosphate synthase
MTAVLVLLLVNAVLGAWDTLWYHEYRARLTAKIDVTRTELQLHAARDAVYVGLYGFLALWQPEGLAVWVVLAGLGAEVVITLCDFVIEDRDRPALGGMAPGERVLHSLMAIVYGAMIAHLVPELLAGSAEPTAAVRHGAPMWLSVLALVAATGIAASGVRDSLALGGFDPVWERARFGVAEG